MVKAVRNTPYRLRHAVLGLFRFVYKDYWATDVLLTGAETAAPALGPFHR